MTTYDNNFKVKNGLDVAQDLTVSGNATVTNTITVATLYFSGDDTFVTSAAGLQGYTGSVGNTGSSGYTGSKGNQGDMGIRGYTGSFGTTGYTGSFGSTGFTGSKGDQGDMGPSGPQGNTGYTGSIGTTGYTGSFGTTGYTGSKGNQGDMGPTGPSGPQGNTGNDGTSVTIIGTVPTVGVNAQTTLNAAYPGAMAGNGVIDETSGDLWVYGGTTWADVGQIKGDKGYTGSVGDQGITGYTGSFGSTGYTGSSGTNGYTGSFGSTGFTGSKGNQGDTGYVGSASTVPGPSGYTGSAGSYNQSLNTTSDVTFNSVTSGGSTGDVSYPLLTGNGIVQTAYFQSGISGTSAVNLDLYSASSYVSAKYTIQVVDSGSVYITEMLLTQDGTNVYETEYGQLSNNGLLGTFSAVLNSGNIVLKFTPTGASNMTIRVVKTLFAL